MEIYIFKFGASELIDFHKKENPITAAILTINFLRKDRPMLVNHATDNLFTYYVQRCKASCTLANTAVQSNAGSKPASF